MPATRMWIKGFVCEMNQFNGTSNGILNGSFNSICFSDDEVNKTVGNCGQWVERFVPMGPNK